MEFNTSLEKHVIDTINERIASGKPDEELNLHGRIIETVEKAMIQTVMDLCRYNQSKSARALGLSREQFRRKLSRYFGDLYFSRIV